MSTEPLFAPSTSQRFHAGAAELFDAIPAPVRVEGVAAAQAECLRVWESRGSFGCERHLFVAAMGRVSRVLFVAGSFKRLASAASDEDDSYALWRGTGMQTLDPSVSYSIRDRQGRVIYTHVWGTEAQEYLSDNIGWTAAPQVGAYR